MVVNLYLRHQDQVTTSADFRDVLQVAWIRRSLLVVGLILTIYSGMFPFLCSNTVTEALG